MSTSTTVESVLDLYRTHAEDLKAVCAEQREHLATHQGRLTPQLDDVEAELTYLLVRHHRPAQVVEIGTFYGWSTTWLLRALRDNGTGRLDSYDLVDHAVSLVPRDLAADRWTFHQGDIAQRLADLPDPDHLFVDADHSRGFARWYLGALFPRVRPGVPTSVHDVFHERWSRPWSEGREVLRWLDRSGTAHLTAAERRAPDVLRAVEDVRRDLGITGVRGTRTNPMIWFTMPAGVADR
jgi:predicted O-methyltransferase YrrM